MADVQQELVVVGRILKEWGLKGDLLVMPLTFDPKRFYSLHEVFVQIKNAVERKKIREARLYKDNLLLRFDGCETPEHARKYRGALIKIDKSESPKLPEGIYYHYQVVGLDVYNTSGDYLGKVREIIETASNDVYVVKSDDKEYLIPAIKEFIAEIDIESKKIIAATVELQEG